MLKLLSGGGGPADPVQDEDLWPCPAASEEEAWRPEGGAAGEEREVIAAPPAGESQSCRPMRTTGHFCLVVMSERCVLWQEIVWQVVSSPTLTLLNIPGWRS